MKTEMRTSGLIVVAALLLLAAPAMAEPSMPFVIDGYVHEFCGDPCNGTWVRVTNTNTSASWDAENSSASNYYRLMISSDNVSAGNVLRFDAQGCSQSKTIEYTVTAGEIWDGGFISMGWAKI